MATRSALSYRLWPTDIVCSSGNSLRRLPIVCVYQLAIPGQDYDDLYEQLASVAAWFYVQGEAACGRIALADVFASCAAQWHVLPIHDNVTALKAINEHHRLLNLQGVHTSIFWWTQDVMQDSLLVKDSLWKAFAEATRLAKNGSMRFAYQTPKDVLRAMGASD